jgi:glutamate-ammonia-ligase adenylyltransferase
MNEARLARLGFRTPERSLRELPAGWEADARWLALLQRMGDLADPDGALRRLVAVGDRAVELALAQRPPLLLSVLGFSEHLAGIVRRTPGLVDELAGGSPARYATLREHRDATWTMIAARDLSGEAPIERTMDALTALADECVASVLGDDVDGFAVMAMGKYGGRELNYASDIDVLFVCRDREHEDAERVARAVMSGMNGLFRVDADLRPQGRDGPLVRSLDAYDTYYRRWAEIWEFQALIKCRYAAGDAQLGSDFLAMVQPFVWPETMPREAIEQIRALKARAEREVERKGLQARQVKLGPGGIRDVEFAVQLLQLVHGRHHPELRVANTLEGLHMLGAGAFISEQDAAGLAEAYVHLRAAEHRLQLVGGRQTHTLPAKAADLEHLARGLGFRDSPRASSLEAFETHWRATTAAVRQIHERLFYRPLLDAFATTPALGPALSAEEARERLAALGFDRPPRAQQSIERLTAGASRHAKVMRAILPGLLAWLSETPEPDAGLSRLEELKPAFEARPQLLALLRDSPPTAELLCRALGTGPVLASLLRLDPSLIAGLSEEHPPLAAEAHAVASRAGRSGLRRFKDGVWLRIAARDLEAGDAPATFVDTSRAMSDLADACVQAALDVACGEQEAIHGGPPRGGFAVVGMGRLGGRELSYASDLDVMFVYEREGACPDGTEAFLYHAAVAERLSAFLSATPPIFKVDAEIRPEGRNGPLVLSLEGFAHYYERRAATWEFQALTRARHAAGDPAVSAALLELAAPRVWPADLSPNEVSEIRHIKARIERERAKAREDLKLGLGGLADVEFTVQLEQMRHGHDSPDVRCPNTLDGIGALERAHVVDDRDAEWLRDAYLMLNRVRNHMFLLRGLATDALPSRDDDLERLARSLGYPRPARSQFLEDYRRVTRRARRVCDRLFYGVD